LGGLAGIYTVIVYINSFDRKDLTLVDCHKFLLPFLIYSSFPQT
jgi:hypothetical protein